MRVEYDVPWPVSAPEVAAISRLIDEGKIKDGDRLDARKLADLLGCTHEKLPCAICFRAN